MSGSNIKMRNMRITKVSGLVFYEKILGSKKKVIIIKFSQVWEYLVTNPALYNVVTYVLGTYM